MSASRLRLRCPAMLMLVLHTAGCMTWQVSTVPPRALIEEEEPVSVRVRPRHGGSMVLSRPRLAGDSIAVLSGGCTAVGEGPNRRYRCPTRSVIALDDVVSIEVRQVSRRRTLLVLSPVVAFFGLVLAYSISCGSKPNQIGC